METAMSSWSLKHDLEISMRRRPLRLQLGLTRPIHSNVRQSPIHQRQSLNIDISISQLILIHLYSPILGIDGSRSVFRSLIIEEL